MGECLGGYGVMGVYGGIEPTWAAQTNVGRTHIATKGIVQSGLVLNLDAGVSSSYPGSGTTWTDLSGNGNNGTLVNGVGYNSGNGGSLVFDGVNDYVRVPSTNGLYFAGQSNITVSWWGKINSYNNQGNNFVMWEDILNGNGRELRLGCFSLNSFAPRFELWRSPGSDGTNNAAIGTTTMNTSIFYNVVGTYDGTNIRVYLNGLLEGTTNWVGTIATPVSGSSVRWIISAGELGDPRYLNSNTSQVSIYNRALSASEIQQNFIATRSRFGI
jgi:hypothetical protein